jgi:serine/threonine-protein kinase
MESASSSEVKFEIGHVLFIDIVGYSKLLISEQSEQIQKLKEIVRGTEQVRLAEAEGKLLRLSTGDGGALVFRNNPEAPVLCALEISKALKKHPELRVRMGIHSGPVNEVVDLNEQSNIAGAGINIAQRVMDCGDADHILLSKRVAEDLAHYRQWQPLLHDLGEVEVKHGARVHLFNLYNEELGNPEVPERLHPKEQGVSDASARREEGFWVAVLPFKYVGGNADLSALADGLTDEIVTGLSRFSYLNVISRSSTSRYANEFFDIRSAGKELGARYVMEGNLRQAATKLRLAVQLVDAKTGAHLWAENYERAFSPETFFELQDELVPRIVSTVADQYGALVHSMSESLRGRSAGEYSAHEAVLRAFGYQERFTLEEHGEVREILEAAIARAPSHSDCLAELSFVYWHEYVFGYNPRPDPLGRAHAAAQRAVASAPSSHFAHSALASVLFFHKNFPAFRPAAERALALNRMDSSTAAILGTMIAYAGDWEYGVAVVERAKQLNPHHPGWYHYLAVYDAYRRHNYRSALANALKVNMPGYYWPHATLAAVYGQLGEEQRARAALRELHALLPNFGAMAREEYGKWNDAEFTEHLLDGLRKAGLSIPALSFAERKSIHSNQSLTVPEKSIAVLPFANTSGDPNNEYFSDGLSEELIGVLAKVRALKTIGRSSSFLFKGTADDSRAIGQKLGVANLLEGSVLKQGRRVRIVAELIDAADGRALWTETYDRELKDVFAVQSEIATAVTDQLKIKLFGATQKSDAEPSNDNLAAYNAFQQGNFYLTHGNAGDFRKAIEFYDEAIRLNSSYALAYANLSRAWLLLGEAALGGDELAVAYGKARSAARTALSLAPNLSEAHEAMGLCLADADFNFEAAGIEFQKAEELAPAAARPKNALTFLLFEEGRLKEGEEMARKALALDPLVLGPYFNLGRILIARQSYDEAETVLRKAIELAPKAARSHMQITNIHLLRGNIAAALEEARLEPPGFWQDYALALAQQAQGDGAAADAALQKFIETYSVQGPFQIATIYALRREPAEMFAWLDRAYTGRDAGLLQLLTAPFIHNYRGDPRFAALCQKLNLPTPKTLLVK